MTSRIVLASLLAALLPPPVTAQPVRLVADILPDDDFEEAFWIEGMIDAGELQYIVGAPVSEGAELWRTDGTPEGTFLVADLCPGPCGSVQSERTIALGERLVFAVGDFFSSTVAPGLWIADGRAGTVPELLLEQVVGEMVVAEDRVLFFGPADDGLRSRLWATDGTRAGTVPISQPLFGLRALTEVGSRAYFVADGFGVSLDLWVTDGTAGGTTTVKTFDTFDLGVHPLADRAILNVGNGTELWISDGTPTGTFRLLERQYTQGGVLLATGHHVFFAFRDVDQRTAIWASGGSPGEGEIVARVDTIFAGFAQPAAVSTASGEVFFLASDPGTGLRLWRSDGTAAGTLPLKEIGSDDYLDDRVIVVATESKVYFSVFDGDVTEVWTSDGSVAGTRRVVTLEGQHARPVALGFLGDRLIYRDREDVGEARLWVTDGTAAGTAILLQVPEGGRFGSDFAHATGERVYFDFSDGVHGIELWSTDGTASDTRMVSAVADATDGAAPSDITAAGGSLFFNVFDRSIDPDLWRSDGRAAGTTRIEDLPPRPRIVGALGDGIVVYTDYGDGIWITDGIPGGSTLLATGTLSRRPPALAHLDGGALLLDRDHDGFRLWSTDGSAAGTRLLIEAEETRGYAFQQEGPVVAAGRVFFTATTDLGAGLWTSDGNEEGTRLLEVDFDPQELVSFRGLPYFLDESRTTLWTYTAGAFAPRLGAVVGRDLGAVRALGATELGLFLIAERGGNMEAWISDGTVAGTLLVGTLPVPAETAPVFDLVATAGAVYFAFRDATHGRELWTIDTSGPRLVRDICPGRCWSYPQDLTAIGNQLWFAASDLATGLEPWVSDGSDIGTRKVVDLAPGPESSNPRSFAIFGDEIYFQAHDRIVGAELFAYAPGGDCPNGAERACLGDGRFEVSVGWRNQHAGGATGTGRAIPFSDDSTLFWFFHPSNVELGLKVLDGRRRNDRFWIFYGALSDVEYWVDVRDRLTGFATTYHNPPGELCGRGDTDALPGSASAAAYTASGWLGLAEPAQRPPIRTARGADGNCTPSDRVLCLREGRIQVEVSFVDQHGGGRQGFGHPLEGTDQTGFFWFFVPGNLELMVKVLDGRPRNGKFWVFYGALTDIEFDLTVIDTVTGNRVDYHNPPGELCGRGDTNAL